MMHYRNIQALAFALTAALAGTALAANPADLTFFETKVRPILATHCFKCHGPDKQRSDLRWDHIDFALKGGERGPALVPGEPDKSRMITAISYKDRELRMPPTGRLSKKNIATLTEWVRRGAPWPDEPRPAAGEGASERFDLEKRKQSHWSWRAIQKVAPPAVKQTDWPASPIDRFVLARLEAKNLAPAADADRRTLIRRVYLDLIGLPPTPDQVNAYLNDSTPDAYEKVVDNLLASPAFGERWGRHWLDLVRYAESYGHEFDFTVPEAYRYRDYVIRALNDDVPYDRIVREHVAGDLVEPRVHPETKINESILATGFWFLHEQTHAPTDVRQHEADRMDNQIDVFTKAFLGLTVACARCHDHKFDAISAKDFYALSSYMQSSRQQMAYLDPGGNIDTAIAQAKTVLAEGQAAFASLNAPLTPVNTHDHKDSQLFDDFNDGDYGGWRATGWAWGEAPTVPGQWDPRSGGASPIVPGVAHSGMFGDKAVGTLRSPEFDLAQTHVWIRVFGKGKIRLVIDSFTINRFNALLFRGLDVNVDTKGKWQWIAIAGDTKLYAGKGDHRAHLEVIDDVADGYLAIDEVRFSGGPGPVSPAFPPTLPSVAPQANGNFVPITGRFHEVTAKIPGSPRALAITDGTGEDTYVYVRGSWRSKGEPARRRLLTALGGERMPELKPEDGSGRNLLVDAMFTRDNPYPARVRVNRIWHHLFGRGIVPTVDNFGVLGAEPTHPQLLDYLAERFRSDLKWSQKAMIREIVLSRTYRMSSKPTDAKAEELDGANELLHRQRIRRMEGEVIRDSILAVSGRLDRKMYGPSVPVHLTSFMEGRGRPKGGPLDGAGRRSIYQSVRRNFLAPMFLAFDTPAPFSTVGRRTVSNVPAQALILMNDPFVVQQSQVWAKRIIAEVESPSKRIERMYLEAYARPPTADEVANALGFFKSQSVAYGLDRARARNDVRLWSDLAHVLLNVKEFIVVN